MAARKGRTKKTVQKVAETVTEAVKDVKKTAESAVETAADKAKSVEAAAKENFGDTAEKITEAGKKAAEKAEKAAGKVVEKAEDAIQAVETKRRGRKPGGTSKTAKDKTVDIGNFFEIDGQQIKVEDVIMRIQEAYKADGHRIGSIKSMQVYYNFAERKAYYVINGKAEDKFVSF